MTVRYQNPCPDTLKPDTLNINGTLFLVCQGQSEAEKQEQKELAIGLGVGLPLLVISLILVFAFWHYKKMKRQTRMLGVEQQDVRVQEEIQIRRYQFQEAV